MTDTLVENSKNTSTAPINTNGGDVHFGDITKIYGKSHDYQELVSQIKEVEMDIEDLPLDKIERRLEKGKRLAELTKKREDFEGDIIRLAETFTKIPINTERLRLAKEHFEEGRFREADVILKAEEMSHEQNSLLDARKHKTRELDKLEEDLKNNANEFLIKARITATDYNSPTRFEDSCKYFEQAIRSQADLDNLFNYAKFLQGHNQFNKASFYYQKILEDFGETLTPANKATTLNNLGNLQSDRNELNKAEESYNEALDTYRKLAEDNPQAFLPNVASTLNNLGNLQSDKNELDKAEDSYNETLGIRRKLAIDHPQAYLPDLAMTLRNLSIFYLQISPDNKKSIRYAKETIETLKSFATETYMTQQYLERAQEILKYWKKVE
ncbi:TPR-repeat-containing protein? [hydrothermal vent metagenome]|uniref:TPR-repeat-containing protein n=1 Tax=hydrothermal vent metagenome TaxID=652676 RepID=A0A3B0RK81_9ZZZZ